MRLAAMRKAFRWKWWIAVIGLVLYFIKWSNIECKIDSSRRMQRSFCDCCINQNAFSCQRWRENSQNSRDALCGNVQQTCLFTCVLGERECTMEMCCFSYYLLCNLSYEKQKVEPVLDISIPAEPEHFISFTMYWISICDITCLGFWTSTQRHVLISRVWDSVFVFTDVFAKDIRKSIPLLRNTLIW